MIESFRIRRLRYREALSMRRLTLLLPFYLLLAAEALLCVSPARANTVTIYTNFSEDPAAGYGSYPYACPSPQCSNLYAYSTEWFGQINFGGGINSYGQQLAMPFTVGGSQDLYLSQVSLAM